MLLYLVPRLLRNEGQDTTKLYYTIEILYLVAFIMIRGVIGSYAVYKILKSDMFATDEKAMAVIFYVVSILFIHEILGYISYKYKQKVVSMPNKHLIKRYHTNPHR